MMMPVIRAYGRGLMWSCGLLVWVVFALWYSNTRGALTPAEVDHYMSLITQGRSGDGAALRAFLESDTGKPFVMVNIIDMAKEPVVPAGASPGATAADLMAHYMEYMWPALLARACHPLFVGVSVAPALDLVGVEGAAQWEQGALMRYRSRRDMMEIATNPVFADRHAFKVAALEKTIAFPVETQFFLLDLRAQLALLMVAFLTLVDLMLWRSR